MSCSTGCPTPGAHESYGECLRSKSARVAYANSAAGFDFSKEKQWNRDLDAYARARAEGIQPAGTARDKVDAAVALSDLTGTAFRADK